MRSFEVTSSRSISLALFADVANSKELLLSMQEGKLELEVAFLNASLIPDVFPVLTAAHKALLSQSRGFLTTRTLHSELVYNYSGSKHISESLKRCGISDNTTYILAARFDASIDEMPKSSKGPKNSEGNRNDPAWKYCVQVEMEETQKAKGYVYAREKINLQIDAFKHARGFFGWESAISTRKKRSPADWWSQFGDECPELQKFAIRVLGLTCSASGCERNWSSFNQMKCVEELIQGKEVDLGELEARANVAQIQKHFKIPGIELAVSSLANAIACRIASRDAL